MNIQTVMDLVRKLTNVTVQRGATEAEALCAANKMQELLMAYNLTIDAVFLGENKCVDNRVETHSQRRKPIDWCILAIAAFCDCKGWFSHARHQNAAYHFFGMESDTAMAKYLYHMIESAIDTETTQFQNTPEYERSTVHYKTLITSFQRGMAARISTRLTQMTKARKAAEVVALIPGTSKSMALMKVNKVDQEYKALDINLVTVSRKVNCHESAYDSGVKAGGKVNLNRPLSGSVAIAGLLT